MKEGALGCTSSCMPPACMHGSSAPSHHLPPIALTPPPPTQFADPTHFDCCQRPPAGTLQDQLLLVPIKTMRSKTTGLAVTCCFAPPATLHRVRIVAFEAGRCVVQVAGRPDLLQSPAATRTWWWEPAAQGRRAVMPRCSSAAKRGHRRRPARCSCCCTAIMSWPSRSRSGRYGTYDALDAAYHSPSGLPALCMQQPCTLL